MKTAPHGPDLKAVGDLLRVKREGTGLSQAAVAKIAGVSRHTVIRMEAGEIGNFAPLVRVARAVGASLDQMENTDRDAEHLAGVGVPDPTEG